MNKFFNRIRLEILIIISIGFLPLLWFEGSEVILGHDSGLVISPISHFIDRLYLWTYRFGLGQDQTYALSGFMIHGFEALISYFVKDLQLTQKVFFIFWFVLPGVCMYVLGRYVEKKLEINNIAIISALFYMVNHFLLQGWFIVERTKFSLYAALPIFIFLLLKWIDKKSSNLRTGLFVSLLFFLLNGNASFPLFGGVIVVFFVFFLFYIYPLYKDKRIKDFIFLLFTIGFTSLLLNFYWLLPFYFFIKSSYSQAVAQVGGVSGVLTWVNYISRDSSILNLIRLQGIPEWYQNPDHPYANIFLSNILFVVIGFLIPVIVFIQLFFLKKFKDARIVLFLLLTAIVSIVFVAGSHPPFGAFYIAMVKFVPGFIAFRTPFYKFAPALWFSYSLLLGISLSFLLNRYIKKKLFSNTILFFILLGIVLYSYPFLDGSFFNYISNKRTMKTKVPQYVYDFRNWVENKKVDSKILALPFSNRSLKVDAYTWDYWSLSPISSLLTSATIVNRNGMNEDELQIFDQLDSLIRNSNPGWKNLAQLLDIKYFLLRKDFVADSEGSVTFPLDSYIALTKDRDIKFLKSFGLWDIYELQYKSADATRLQKLEGGKSKIGIIATLPEFNPNDFVYTDLSNSEIIGKIDSITSSMYIVPSCIFCNLEYQPLNRDLYRPLITKGSIFYTFAEKKDLQQVSKLVGVEKTRHYLYKSLEFLLAFDKVVIEDRDLTPIPLILDAYDSEIDKFKNSLNVEISKKSNLNDFLLEIENVLRVEEELMNDNSGKLTDKVILERLSKSFSKMREVKKIVKNSLWRTEDEINKRFLLNIEKNANYNIFLRTNYAKNNFENIKFKLDDDNFETPKIEKNGWLDLGSYKFSRGLHRLEFTVPTYNIYTGKIAEDISTAASGSCYSSEIYSAIPGEEYKISFNHVRLKGNKKFYFKINSEGQLPNLLDKTDSVINAQGQWDTYETIYKAVNIPTDKFYFSICNPPDLTEKYTSSIRISEINVRKISIPDLVVKMNLNNKSISRSAITKETPTNYYYDIKNEGVAILPTSFNINWDLNEKAPDFTLNGYANGWVVDKGRGNIEYRPQRLVVLGFIISGVSLLIIVAFLIYGKIKKNK